MCFSDAVPIVVMTHLNVGDALGARRIIVFRDKCQRASGRAGSRNIGFRLCDMVMS